MTLTARLLVLVVFVGCTVAQAHERSESYSNWRIIDDRMTGVITVSQGEIMALVELDNTRTLDALFADHARQRITVQSEDGACAVAEPVSLEAARGFLRTELRFACAGSAPWVRCRAKTFLGQTRGFLRVIAQNPLLTRASQPRT